MKKDSLALLFSGGTDSTLAAALERENYQKIHLLTFKRFGLYNLDNTKKHAQKLLMKFGNEKYEHHFIDINKIFKLLSYENYISNVKRHGFFMLSTCGFCKLAMHARAIVYALENNIKFVGDGANESMDIYPFQMLPVIEKVRELYRHFGITLENPVFYEKSLPGKKLIQNFDIDTSLASRVQNLFEDRDEKLIDSSVEHSGKKLYNMGVIPEENIKGTLYDREHQGRCFQLVLFRVFAKKYYLTKHSHSEYTREILKLFSEKMEVVKKLIEEYRDEGKHKELFR